MRWSHNLNPDQFPLRPEFMQFPFRVGKLGKDGEVLIVYPDATLDLCSMTPRERWKIEWQRERLARKGIRMETVKGQIGSLK